MKQFAILIIGTLRVVRFDSKDELQDALKTLRANDKAFLVFKWHHGLERYVPLEIWE